MARPGVPSQFAAEPATVDFAFLGDEQGGAIVDDEP
jgi:hypothetical protein